MKKNFNPATLVQSSRLLSLVDQKGLTREQLQNLFDSGLFSDLLEAFKKGIIPEVKSDEFKKFRVGFKKYLGIFFYKIEKTIAIFYSIAIDDKRNRFNYFDKDITEANFGFQFDSIEEIYDVKLINFNEPMTSKQVIDILDDLGLRPGTPKELESYVIQSKLKGGFGDCIQIVALGDIWEDRTGTTEQNAPGVKKIVQYCVSSDAMALTDWNLKKDASAWFIALKK